MRKQRSRHRARRICVDRPPLDGFERTAPVERLAHAVDHAAEQRVADRHRQRTAQRYHAGLARQRERTAERELGPAATTGIAMLAAECDRRAEEQLDGLDEALDAIEW